MKTTLELPDDLLRAVQRHAQSRGQEISIFVAGLLRRALALSIPAATASPPLALKSHPQSGLPFFEGRPDAPARRMSIEELLEIETRLPMEDDLERVGLPLR